MKSLLIAMLLVSGSVHASAPECGKVIRIDPTSSKGNTFRAFMIPDATFKVDGEPSKVSSTFELGMSGEFAKNMADIQMAMTAFQSETLLCRCESTSRTATGGVDYNYRVVRQAMYVGDCK
ncbi:MAG: hypothetical protein KA715_13135 [Xanthomonadaceae bacterium]|nr:hypothetical protein [Xanthomonadaceae bacterium]